MKPILIDRSSWHFVLATQYGWFYPHERADICKYGQHLLLGFVVAVVLIALGVLVLLPWVDWLALWLAHDFVLSTKYSAIAGVEIGAGVWIGATLLVGRALRWLKGRSKEYSPPPAPSPLKLAYRAWKGKYCTRVDFK